MSDDEKPTPEEERAAPLRQAFFLIDRVGLECKEAGFDAGWYACNRALRQLLKAESVVTSGVAP